MLDIFWGIYTTPPPPIKNQMVHPLIQEKAHLTVSKKSLTIYSLMVVLWANVINEQWQINNVISWKFLFKTPYVNPKKQFVQDKLNRCVHAS